MITLNSISTTAIAAATGAAVQEFAGIVNQRLCKSVCTNQSIQPTANVTYSVDKTYTSGTTTFVRITYVPKGRNGCSTLSQSFTEYTTLVFSNSAATAAPTISLVQGLSHGYLSDVACLTANRYEVATEVTVTATYA